MSDLEKIIDACLSNEDLIRKKAEEFINNNQSNPSKIFLFKIFRIYFRIN